MVEEIEQSIDHSCLNVFVFDIKVYLTKENPVFEHTLHASGVPFKLKIELTKSVHPIYDDYYCIVFRTDIFGLISNVHSWSKNQVVQAYLNGVLEKFILRTIFSKAITGQILKINKY